MVTVKLKVTRTDGTVIEAEGPAEELLKLNLIPWQLMTYTTPGTTIDTGTAVYPFPVISSK